MANKLDILSERAVTMANARGWSMDWPERGACLHLEVSELIEAVRGKHGDPLKEAGDVLVALMIVAGHNGMPLSAVMEMAGKTISELEMKPPYAGEETAHKKIERLEAQLEEYRTTNVANAAKISVYLQGLASVSRMGLTDVARRIVADADKAAAEPHRTGL